MVLILTSDADQVAKFVSTRMTELGVDHWLFDPEEFPAHASLSVAVSTNGQAKYWLRARNGTLDLGRVSAVWWRRPGQPRAPSQVRDAEWKTFVEQESQEFLRGLWAALDCLWIPAPPHVLSAANGKLRQLTVAGKVGFEVPETLFTNEPNDFFDFYQDHDGRVVSKLATPASFYRTFPQYMRFADIVPRHYLGHLQSISYAPALFQEYVDKSTELRVTVVGREVFPAEIHSQKTRRTRHDWRRYDLERTPHGIAEIPPEIEERCQRIVEQLGLLYGAIDLVRTPDGRFVFLEVNPNGQYLWIEQMTGLRITAALIRSLAGASQGSTAHG